MRTDPAQLVAQYPAGARHRPARHHHAARREGAEAEGGALGVAVTHRDPRRVDAEFLGGDLRQRRFQTLAVRLDADHQHDAAIRQDTRSAALETRNDRGAAGGEFGSAVRGLLGKSGEPDADKPPIGLTAMLARADPWHVQQLGAQPHALRIIAAVEAHAADRRERHLFGAHQIEEPHVVGLMPGRPGDLVDQPLDHKARPRTADPAIRAERRLVRRHRMVFRAVVRDRVRPRQRARHHPGFMIRPLRPQPVSAGIDGDLGVNAEDMALPVGVGRDLVVVIAGMRRSQQMLVTVLDPAHRVIELQCQCRQDDFFRVEPGLGPEPAADIGRDDADAALLEIENFGQCDAHRVRRLGRSIDHDLVEAVVAIGEHAAAFERRARLPLHAKFAGHRHSGRARRGIDVAVLQRMLDVEIVAPLLMYWVAASAHVARRVDHRFQYLEIDRNAAGEVFRLAARRRNAGGNGFADITHLVGGERRPGRRFGAGRVRDDADRLDARQIRRGKDAALRLGRHRDRSDPCMSMRAANKRNIHRARQFYVRDELAAPVQVPVVLPAQQRGADAKPVVRHWPAPSPIPWPPRRSP